MSYPCGPRAGTKPCATESHRKRIAVEVHMRMVTVTQSLVTAAAAEHEPMCLQLLF